MKKIVLLIAMAITTVGRGEEFAEEYQAASLFSALIGADNPATVSPTNTWVPPSLFVFPADETNIVSIAKVRNTAKGSSFFINCRSSQNNYDATINVCSNRTLALEELCFPIVAFSSMPIEMIASGYSSQANESGVIEISAVGNVNDLSLIAFGNISVQTFGSNSKNFALALLRAGGVDIPEEPLRSSPPSSPPAQAMRVFSSDPPEDASSSPPAPEPFQAMLVFPSDLENETDSSASESRPESESEQEF